MQPQVFSIGTGAKLTKELACPQGEKFAMVLKGKMELLCGSEKLILEEGDSIYFAYTRKPLKVLNAGKSEVKLLWIVFVSV